MTCNVGLYAQYHFDADEFTLSKQDGKYGFVNSKGELVIEYKYEEATEFNRYAFVKVTYKEQVYLLDTTRREYIGNLSNLRILDLSNNNPIKLPKSLINLKKLK